jgi:hypothetical protein
MERGRSRILVPSGNQWNGGEQRALQDWYVNLQTVPEWLKLLLWRFRKAIGFRSFKMQYYNVSMMEVMKAVKPVTMM